MGVLGDAFAIRNDEIIYMAKGHISSSSVANELRGDPLSAIPKDITGIELVASTQRYANTAGRDSAFIINTGEAVYSTNVSD